MTATKTEFNIVKLVKL